MFGAAGRNSLRKSALRRLGAVAFVATLSCVSPYKIQAPFVLDEFARYALAGNSTIVGQAFLKTIGGDVKVGAGEDVILMPANPYTAEIINNVIVPERKASNADQRVGRYCRRTTVDAQGNFEFTSIPAGSYFAVTAIEWSVSGRVVTEGGWIFKKIDVRPNETAKVILTW